MYIVDVEYAVCILRSIYGIDILFQNIHGGDGVLFIHSKNFITFEWFPVQKRMFKCNDLTGVKSLIWEGDLYE